MKSAEEYPSSSDHPENKKGKKMSSHFPLKPQSKPPKNSSLKTPNCSCDTKLQPHIWTKNDHLQQNLQNASSTLATAHLSQKKKKLRRAKSAFKH